MTIRSDGKKTLFDVVAVNIQTGVVRLMASKLDYEDANNFKKMAICRRGVETEFFSTVPAGTYGIGDQWRDQ
jgi:hypothetical protein